MRRAAARPGSAAEGPKQRLPSRSPSCAGKVGAGSRPAAAWRQLIGRQREMDAHCDTAVAHDHFGAVDGMACVGREQKDDPMPETA